MFEHRPAGSGGNCGITIAGIGFDVAATGCSAEKQKNKDSKELVSLSEMLSYISMWECQEHTWEVHREALCILFLCS